jgi:hypothetical protein
MTSTTSRPTRRRSHSPHRSNRATASRPRRRSHPAHPSDAHRKTIARYTDWSGRVREIVTRAGCAGSILVLDCDAVTHDDRRLVAHLANDEPLENAAIASSGYLAQARRGRYRCRALQADDLTSAPFTDPYEQCLAPSPSAGDCVIDGLGWGYRLAPLETGMSIPELRWCRRAPTSSCQSMPLSVREAIARLESYEPVRTLTCRALAVHSGDGEVSITALRAELLRVQKSPIVLNRGLREAMLAVIERQGVSMSEIAVRCGRIKRDSAGNESGETSWLARRLGLRPEGGRQTPTPWIHSDVLALIARDGLGLSPREVELD